MHGARRPCTDGGPLSLRSGLSVALVRGGENRWQNQKGPRPPEEGGTAKAAHNDICDSAVRSGVVRFTRMNTGFLCVTLAVRSLLLKRIKLFLSDGRAFTDFQLRDEMH